jgi:hypothetical protein
MSTSYTTRFAARLMCVEVKTQLRSAPNALPAAAVVSYFFLKKGCFGFLMWQFLNARN